MFRAMMLTEINFGDSSQFALNSLSLDPDSDGQPANRCGHREQPSDQRLPLVEAVPEPVHCPGSLNHMGVCHG